MAKRFLYLVQSSSERLPGVLPLRERPSADYLFLTYDKPMEGALFLQGCSWGRGRNELYRQGRQRPGYDYYIFIDDDVAFAKGSYDRFEELLLRLRPAFACPVFIPKTLYTVFGLGRGLLRPPFACLQSQVLRRGDGQVTALHRDVFEDGLVFPVQEQLDALSWWCTSSTIQTVAWNLYGRHCRQLNPVAVLNLAHRPYVRNVKFEAYDRWLQAQFRGPVQRPEETILNPFSGDGFTRLRQRLRGPLPRKHRLFLDWVPALAGSLAYRPKVSYGFTPETLATILNPGSDLFRQYQRLSPRSPAAAGGQPGTAGS